MIPTRLALLCAVALAASAGPAGTQPAAIGEPAASAATTIDPDLPDTALRTLRDELERARTAARVATQAERQRLEPLRRQIDALGAIAEGDDANAADPNAALRVALRAAIAEAEAALAAAQLAETRIDLNLEQIAALTRQRLRTRLISRGPSPLDPAVWLAAADAVAREAAAVAAESARAATDVARLRAAAQGAPLALVAVLAGLALIRLLLRRVARWTAFALARGGASASARIGSGMAATLARMALHLASVALLSWAALTSGLLGPRAAIFVATLTEAALALVAVYALASAYLAPRAAALRVAPLDDRRARKALRRALALAGVAAAEHVLLRPLYRADASEAALSVVNFALVATGGLLLWRLQSVFARALPAVATQPAQAVADAPELVEPPASLAEQAADMVRTATQVVAVAAPALAAMGYLAASRALFLPFVGSLGVLGLALLAHGLIRVATGGGRVAALRDPTQHDPAPPAPSGGAIAPAASAAALLALSLPPLAMVWGADRTVLAAVWRAVVEGVDLGSLRIAPLDLLTFLAIFASGYALTRIAQRIVAASGPGGGKGATEGARAALVSIMGYAGVILSAGVAVSSVGLDLSNLALLAGALSVGVGFGLQGIVNNFISGVILQIEQPVKVGDWIEVNGVHGLVRRITVRSTVIETFDRAAYVVPNADLVAHPVTNYTHRNRLGRLILRLTVPYESDPRLVERILGEIHQAAPNSRRWPGSGAFLTGFGSSGYEFELRVILRDITGFVAAGSALRLEIADRFRAEGVAFAVARHDVRFMQDPATAVDAGPKPVES